MYIIRCRSTRSATGSVDYNLFVNWDLWNVIKITTKINFNKNRRFLQGKEDNREMVFFFFLKFVLHRKEFRKQHFSNRHSVPLISNRTHSASSPISHFFPSVSLNFLLHATSFFLSFLLSVAFRYLRTF